MKWNSEATEEQIIDIWKTNQKPLSLFWTCSIQVTQTNIIKMLSVSWLLQFLLGGHSPQNHWFDCSWSWETLFCRLGFLKWPNIYKYVKNKQFSVPQVHLNKLEYCQQMNRNMFSTYACVQKDTRQWCPNKQHTPAGEQRWSEGTQDWTSYDQLLCGIHTCINMQNSATILAVQLVTCC